MHQAWCLLELSRNDLLEVGRNDLLSWDAVPAKVRSQGPAELGLKDPLS